MHPEVVITLVLAFGTVAAYAGYVRLVTVRRLRKTLDRLVDQAVARRPAAAGPALTEPAHEADEIRKIHQRLQVLERIAVDKEASLAREIEELRVAAP